LSSLSHQLRKDISQLRMQQRKNENGRHQAAITHPILPHTMFMKATRLLQKHSSLTDGIKRLRVHAIKQFDRHKAACSIECNRILEAIADNKKYNVALRRRSDTLQIKLESEIEQRKNMIDEIRISKGNIRVFARIRPMKPEEYKIDEEAKFTVMSDGIQYNQESFQLDRAFGPSKTQEEVFKEFEKTVLTCMDGYDVCVYAYGQTASGKTFTMEGDLQDPEKCGLMLRTINGYLTTIESRKEVGWKYTLVASAVEIYKEQVYDLLDRNSKSGASSNSSGCLKLYNNKDNDVSIPGLKEEIIKTSADAISFLKKSMKHRTEGRTLMNQRSSRSHAVIMVSVVGAHAESSRRVKGQLMMIDMAGSERLDDNTNQDHLTHGSINSGNIQKMRQASISQTGSINKSISAFRGVLLALARKQQHVPFRDSKLTTLLMKAFLNKSQTIMISTLSPRQRDYEETKRSIEFAALIRNVELGRSESRSKTDRKSSRKKLFSRALSEDAQPPRTPMRNKSRSSRLSRRSESMLDSLPQGSASSAKKTTRRLFSGVSKSSGNMAMTPDRTQISVEKQPGQVSSSSLRNINSFSSGMENMANDDSEWNNVRKNSSLLKTSASMM